MFFQKLKTILLRIYRWVQKMMYVSDCFTIKEFGLIIIVIKILYFKTYTVVNKEFSLCHTYW